MDIRAVLGRNVRKYRDRKGLSQETFAFDAELHRTYVSGVERGVWNPTVLIVAKLATALGVEPHKLLKKMEYYGNVVPLKGLEPPTPSLRMTCSTS